MRANAARSEVAAAKPRKVTFTIDYRQIFKQRMNANAVKSEVAAAKPRKAILKIAEAPLGPLGSIMERH